MKKALPMIMASILATSMFIASSMSAVAVTGTVSSYTNQETGVKVESDAVTITGNDVGIYTGLGMDDTIGLYEEKYDVEMSTLDVNYDEVPIYLYLPCEKENCYVIVEGFESSELVQLDAEYVDGCYKVRMPNWGTYYVCDTPLQKGYSKLKQQTLTDEKTGVSISGKIETGSKLVAFDVRDMYKELEEADYDFSEEPFALMGQFDGYGVFLSRNMEQAYSDGELTVTLPSANEGYEVRCVNVRNPMSDEDTYEDDVLGMSLANMVDTDEDLAVKYTALMDRVFPALKAEYVNGSYVVKNDFDGYYFIAPVGSFEITADEIKQARARFGGYSEMENEYITDDDFSDADESIDFATEEVSAEVEEPSEAETEATKKPATAKSDDEKADSNASVIVPVIIGVAVALLVLIIVITVVVKKKSAKK